MKGLRILAALALLCGCATQRAWVYAPTLPPVPGGPRPERTVVLPFRDARQNVNNNRLGLYLIPLFPFGWADFEVPDGVAISEAVALATELSTDESPRFVNGLLSRLLELKPSLSL